MERRGGAERIGQRSTGRSTSDNLKLEGLEPTWVQPLDFVH